MTYEDQVQQTATSTADQVLAAVALYEAGKLTMDALTAVVAAYIAAGNGAAAALADLSLANVLSAATGTTVAPIGVTRPTYDPERLEKAATTIVEDPKTTVARWQRLAEAEILQAASEAYSEAVKTSPLVKGWVRGLDADPCQLCRNWSRDGRVWPADHPMPRHTGCMCTPTPVLAESIKPVRTRR